MRGHIRRRVEVRGIVQGVGFRPAVHRRAHALGLHGLVGNDGAGVFVEVEGPAAVVEGFVRDLPTIAPPLAVVDAVAVEDVAPTGEQGFAIVESRQGMEASTWVSPDVAPCAACLAELADPADRRHGHPFINCTDCGPRYSIVGGLPYDRARTTMAPFPMCPACASEYADPLDRRYHAQPTCCPDCGPRLRLLDGTGRELLADDDAGAVSRAAAMLLDGCIVAVKGLGGYHVAVDATDGDAVSRLRARKHRDEKPFAVLVAGLDEAAAFARVDPVAAELLAGPERPIVLVPRRAGAAVAAGVAPGNHDLGLLLAPTPLHVLLAAAVGRPLVLTSANRSHEPMVHDDDEAVAVLAGIAEAFLTHDRRIHTRVDDSVARVVGVRPVVLRRARGYAPRPLPVAGGFPRHVLACGAELKSTVCVGRDDRAVLSAHLGDLGDPATRLAFEHAVEHLCRTFSVEPRVVVHDLHPDLASTRFAIDLADERDIEAVAVQHHHAHIASCLVDNEHDGTVIGVAFDGFGFGTDGSAWGGEILLADLRHAERVGHLATVPLPGGDAAAREPWRMALAHLSGTVHDDVVADLAVHDRNRRRWGPVRSVAGEPTLSPPTSSAGRLFDAVAAIVGVRDAVTYEGQAAIELEQLARAAGTTSDLHPYPTQVLDGSPCTLDTAPLIRAVVDDVIAGAPAPTVAARFHRSVVELVVAGCDHARARSGLTTVALSGGVFQNALLCEQAITALADRGFQVLTHRRVPPNDGGISLGQAAVVAALDRR
jgi:hydrogenase maturation protein HypF